MSTRRPQALAKLQRPLLRALGTGGGPGAALRGAGDRRACPCARCRRPPTVNLSYAVFDDKLVISTDPAGVAQVLGRRRAARTPSRSSGRQTDLPDEVSALVFLNLDELFGQVTRTDLVEDPFFANLSVLFENATSAALAVNGDDEEIRSELFLAVD